MKLGKQQGFTLIELVMVIVILGILAAVALPKFADLSGNARKATIQGAYGSVKSASAIVHAKALAEGQTAESGSVLMEGSDIGLSFGYPDAKSIAVAAGISSTDYNIANGEKDKPTTISATKDSGKSAIESCNFTYVQALSSGSTPTISEVVSDGCSK